MTSRPVFGVVAEDPTDCDTLRVLIQRIAENSTVGFKSRAQGGCGSLRRKARAWLAELQVKGATHLIIVHDLDRDPSNDELNDEAALRLELEALRRDLPMLICIPVEELEAWFWSDPKLVAEISNGRASASHHPHTVRRPKEALVTISRDARRRQRYNPNDNPSLAEKLDLSYCKGRCAAFSDLAEFVVSASTQSGAAV